MLDAQIPPGQGLFRSKTSISPCSHIHEHTKTYGNSCKLTWAFRHKGPVDSEPLLIQRVTGADQAQDPWLTNLSSVWRVKEVDLASRCALWAAT